MSTAASHPVGSPAAQPALRPRRRETFIPSRGYVIAVRPNEASQNRGVRWTANLLRADQHGNPLPQSGRRTVYGHTRSATIRQLRWYTAFLALHARHPRLAHAVMRVAWRGTRGLGPGRGQWAICFHQSPCY